MSKSANSVVVGLRKQMGASIIPPKEQQASREVIQDFVPLSESLEWRLGQEYLRQRGNKAFLSDAHPSWGYCPAIGTARG